MKKRKIGLAVGFACFILVSFAAYEILVVPGFIQNKERTSSEKLASKSQSSVNRSDATQTTTEHASQADDFGTKNVKLTWDPVAGADSYNVYWDTAKGVSKDNPNKVPAATNLATIPGLKCGVTYYFVATTVVGTRESTESEELDHKIDCAE